MATPEVSRYPEGVCDATEVGAFSTYAGLRPSRYAQWFNDFFSYTAADWVVSETNASSTQAIVSGNGGVFAITNVAAGATDAASLQWAGSSGAVVTNFTFDSAKDMIIAAKFKVSDATNTGLIIGLAVTDTTPVASLPANGIFFNKVAASTSLLANLMAASSASTVTTATMADNTYVSVVFRYVAATGYWQAFSDDALAGSITSPTSPSVALTLTIGLQNASAVAHVLSVDYLFVAQQR